MRDECNNLSIVVRERGKIVQRYEAHNIWTNQGREWLAGLVSYANLAVVTPERSDRAKYMGFGIGGEGQTLLGIVNGAPYVTDYPGTNDQTNIDPTIVALERPVRLRTGPDLYLASFEDFGFPTVAHPNPNEARFKVFLSGSTDFILGTYTSGMPLSEIALLSSGTGSLVVDPTVAVNPIMSYHTFPSILVTPATDVECSWTVRF